MKFYKKALIEQFFFLKDMNLALNYPYLYVSHVGIMFNSLVILIYVAYP